jgi:hypothetical protein
MRYEEIEAAGSDDWRGVYREMMVYLHKCEASSWSWFLPDEIEISEYETWIIERTAVGFSPAEATFKWCGRSPHVLEVDGDDKKSHGRTEGGGQSLKGSIWCLHQFPFWERKRVRCHQINWEEDNARFWWTWRPQRRGIVMLWRRTIVLGQLL